MNTNERQHTIVLKEHGNSIFNVNNENILQNVVEKVAAVLKPNDVDNDEVHNPSHYQLEGLGIESVDVIRAVLTEEEFQGWCKGNALKYLMRAGKKDPSKEMQDLEKGGVFISWLTEQE